MKYNRMLYFAMVSSLIFFFLLQGIYDYIFWYHLSAFYKIIDSSLDFKSLGFISFQWNPKLSVLQQTKSSLKNKYEGLVPSVSVLSGGMQQRGRGRRLGTNVSEQIINKSLGWEENFKLSSILAQKIRCFLCQSSSSKMRNKGFHP